MQSTAPRPTGATAPHPLGSRRQNPVSCSLCRRKKLRCNRQHPCSNCVSRNVTCERVEDLPRPVPSATGRSSNSDNDAILLRLSRLEGLLVQMAEGRTQGQQTPTSQPDPLPEQQLPQQQTPHSLPDSLPEPQQLEVGTGSIWTADIVGLHSVTKLERDSADDGIETAAEATHKLDSRQLEDVGARDNPLTRGLFDPIAYRICNSASIPAQSSQQTQTGQEPSAYPTRHIWLPAKEEGRVLLERYGELLSYVHNVTHLPTVRKQLELVYDNIQQGLPVRPGEVALLLSTFASAAEIQSKTPRSDIPIMQSDAAPLSILWTKSCLDLLEHSRRTAGESLADLQAMIICYFALYCMEGLSIRLRSGIGAGVATARNMGLHRIDYTADKTNLSASNRDQVELEVMRRVWWWITASDWLTALSCGPSEGVYSIHPRQMMVNLPRNINDYHLHNYPANFSLPLIEPTSMSYLIQRIKLATIVRDFVDAMPLSPASPDLIPYNDFVALDQKFVRFHDDLPFFFQMDEQSARRSKEIYTQMPFIELQKYVVCMTSETRRCTLHQPYLVRGFTNPKYAYSRDVCLSSARKVLDVRRQLERTTLISSGLMSLSGITHHLFFAAIALVLDLCFNHVPDKDDERRAEVLTACQMLAEAKNRSLIANKFVDGLVTVLRKHKVTLGPDALGEDQALGGSAMDLSAHAVREEQDGLEDRWNLDFDALPNQSGDFEEIWQSYVEYGRELEVPDWEKLFSDLDGSTL